MKTFRSLWLSIDMGLILLDVKFEGGLSISILRKKQPYEKKIGAQNR
jgi:hypothetical protein